MATRTLFGVCALLCSFALAGQPPQSPPNAPAPPTGNPAENGQRTPPPDAPADDELIEFLGGDDVGDAAWWEFLKKSAPGEDPLKPAAPPQDARP
jgi:hypothetical protein